MVEVDDGTVTITNLVLVTYLMLTVGVAPIVIVVLCET